MQRDRRLLPYFDIPFQHASAKILRAMGRRGNGAAYLALLDDIRAALPDAVLRSTFLVGFPGEDDDDFAALLAFQQKAALDWAGVFTYAREEDTPAAAMKKRPAKKTAEARRKRLEEAQAPITARNLERFVGRELDVLIEEAIPRDAESDGDERLFIGRAFLNAPEVDGAIVVEAERDLVPGALGRGVVLARAGVDLRARVENLRAPG
jgi:ribosomal protein S12 methylthiotransferase